MPKMARKGWQSGEAAAGTEMTGIRMAGRRGWGGARDQAGDAAAGLQIGLKKTGGLFCSAVHCSWCASLVDPWMAAWGRAVAVPGSALDVGESGEEAMSRSCTLGGG